LKNQHRKPESFIKKVQYPGGDKAIDKFIGENLHYPEEALKNKVEGAVSIEIDIDVFGKVIASRILHGIGSGCDEEAMRLVGLLQFEKKKYRGLRVVHHRTLIIHFRLHTASPPVQQMSYQYKESEKKSPATTYSYSIKIHDENKPS
jgi:TonB family protein